MMAIPLFSTTEFLYLNRNREEKFRVLLQELIDIFSQLRNVNNLEESFIELMSHSCVFTWTDLLNHSCKVLEFNF